MTANQNAEAGMPPVRIHFASGFPIETRGITSGEEPVVVEITKVEYSLEESEDSYDVVFFVSGIKSFSITDDDQECFIKWGLYDHGSKEPEAGGTFGTGNIEMGERFTDIECRAGILPAGDYTFRIIYV